MNEIVKIDPKEFGLEKKKAKEITTGLVQILDERKILSKEYKKTVEMEITEENVHVFKALRLQISKNRTRGIEVWRKTNKEYWLRGGQFVDAIGRKEIAENIRMEDALRSNEEYFENLEKEKIVKLQEERSAELAKYTDEEVEHLGTMSDNIWKNFIEGTKAGAKRQKAEEDERLAKEKAEAERIAKLETQNKELQEEAEKKQAELKTEADRRDKIAAEEKSKADAIIKKEREDREKVEAELRARKEAEEKEEEDRLIAIEAEAKKGDSAKVKDLISDLEALKSKYEFKSKANQKKYAGAGELIDKVVTYINK